MDDVLQCLRCENELTYVGEKDFHEGTRSWGFILGDLGELLTNQETIEMYYCRYCGHVEFFVPEKR
jgi:hypothetical protein